MNLVLGNNKGFTLAEVLIAIGVVVATGIVFAAIYLAQGRLSSNQINIGNAQVKQAIALNTIVKDISQGREVLSSAAIDGVPYTTDADTVVILVSTQSSTDTWVLDLDASDKLNMVVATAPDSTRRDGQRVLLEDVSNFSVVYENPGSPTESNWLDIEITQDIQTSNGSRSVTSQQRVFLRNRPNV